ncbi:uncharacterized protein RMCC_5165 [Mycolicibacterium canariasense]|uniref:HicB-like antitoxin of toxin-antitoxin system domain-containing protein n=1 Tax=Mycolicibacterium canariasense TaxID=228230 RepID=A0A100WHC6_MYCCR|nr:hypothetical protein [Mycolicibacterium canariasense]MCV7210593.1 hypothetical protein [Mycolicibacterium canariasense]ORU96065.1 hypothetical protein AWB94_31285 [Mycolicibacterium canariasense]GAS98200.1 uncharacterized protein RMCC_5165 [Mycolicibacterium canariasense]
MMIFDVEVTRDDRWWMITVPELDGYVTPSGAINIGDTTQARHEGEIEAVARDFVATVLGVPTEDVAVRLPPRREP